MKQKRKTVEKPTGSCRVGLKQIVKPCLIKFRKGNNKPYGQDFGQHRGIPHDIDFEVQKFNGDRFILRAHGYGIIGSSESYGNGSIYFSKKDMTQAQRKLVENCLGV